FLLPVLPPLLQEESQAPARRRDICRSLLWQRVLPLRARSGYHSTTRPPPCACELSGVCLLLPRSCHRYQHFPIASPETGATRIHSRATMVFFPGLALLLSAASF